MVIKNRKAVEHVCDTDGKTMKPLVSVIVPVYKVEEYLNRCLDSLCRQSLTNIEIILVDDASPDRCGVICEAYAAKDTRVRVFHQPENRGLSAARNLGIGYAAGTYLMFVDSDDYVHDDFCKEAYECAVRNQADLVMFNRIRVIKSGDGGRVLKDDPFFSEGYKTTQEALDIMLTDGGNAAWNKLYKKELFEGVSYPEGYLYEDTGATYKLVVKASRVYYLPKALYYHCLRSGSITSQKVTKKVVEDRAELNSQRYRDLVAWGYDSESLDYRFKTFALWYCIRKKKDASDPKYVFLAEGLRSGRIPEKFARRQKILTILFRYFPLLFELLCSIRGTKVC